MWIDIVSKIWNYRNNKVFRNGKVDDIELFCPAQLKYWSWLKHKRSNTYFSYSSWCLCPGECLKSVG